MIALQEPLDSHVVRAIAEAFSAYIRTFASLTSLEHRGRLEHTEPLPVSDAAWLDSYYARLYHGWKTRPYPEA